MIEITTESAARRPVVSLQQARPLEVTVLPDAEWRAALTERLGLLGLKKVRLTAVIERSGDDVHLTGTLGATVTQPCVVTLAPVTTRIETEIERSYLADYEEPEEDEAEMPEDETVEPLGSHVDLGAVLSEELALALPLYPHAEGVAPGAADIAEDDADEDEAPFAGLKALKDKLEGDE
ncbi:DUF177 domain-containing protein [Rhodobacterales bacterium HKCCE3408]|nr:DUF177 domain-containing protein [Rhodobacterales bacterium HKCCE3408]